MEIGTTGKVDRINTTELKRDDLVQESFNGSQDEKYFLSVFCLRGRCAFKKGLVLKRFVLLITLSHTIHR